MNRDNEQLHKVIAPLLKVRGIYADFAKRNHIKYHELLILSALYESGGYTQKQIGELYCLPKQTVYNIIAEYRKKEYLDTDMEGILRLTESGKFYAQSVLIPLIKMEQEAALHMGKQEFQMMSNLVSEYTESMERRISCLYEKKG